MKTNNRTNATIKNKYNAIKKQTNSTNDVRGSTLIGLRSWFSLDVFIALKNTPMKLQWMITIERIDIV